MNEENFGEKIVAILRTIYDPEIPVDIYELGLIYDVEVSEEMEVKITMTLTSPNCPVADSMPQEVKDKVETLDEVKECIIDLVFEPPWTMEMMSEEAKFELGLM